MHNYTTSSLSPSLPPSPSLSTFPASLSLSLHLPSLPPSPSLSTFPPSLPLPLSPPSLPPSLSLYLPSLPPSLSLSLADEIMEKVRDRLVHHQRDLMIIPVASQDEFVSLTLETFPEINDNEIVRYGAGIYRLYYKNISINFCYVAHVCCVFAVYFDQLEESGKDIRYTIRLPYELDWFTNSVTEDITSSSVRIYRYIYFGALLELWFSSLSLSLPLSVSISLSLSLSLPPSLRLSPSPSLSLPSSLCSHPLTRAALPPVPTGAHETPVARRAMVTRNQQLNVITEIIEQSESITICQLRCIQT